MNIIQEIKALWAIKNVVNDITTEVKKMDSIKSGLLSTEFWTKILTVDIPMILGATHGVIPPNIAAYVLLGSNIAYMALRTWLKRDVVIANVKKFVADIKSGQTETLTSVVEKITTPPTTTAAPQ